MECRLGRSRQRLARNRRRLTTRTRPPISVRFAGFFKIEVIHSIESDPIRGERWTDSLRVKGPDSGEGGRGGERARGAFYRYIIMKKGPTRPRGRRPPTTRTRPRCYTDILFVFGVGPACACATPHPHPRYQALPLKSVYLTRISILDRHRDMCAV